MTTLDATGSEIRSWRRIYGMTLKELSERLGVHWITLQRWETGVLSVPPYLHLALRELARQINEAQADA